MTIRKKGGMNEIEIYHMYMKGEIRRMPHNVSEVKNKNINPYNVGINGYSVVPFKIRINDNIALINLAHSISGGERPNQIQREAVRVIYQYFSQIYHLEYELQNRINIPQKKNKVLNHYTL
jgi:hypothetical protein